MSRTLKAALVATAAPFLLLADLPADGTPGLRLGREAAAVVGAPATPVSGAGVARRTTRRVVAAEATAASAASAAAAQQQAAATPAVGSVVSALPAGCVPLSKGGVEYHQCGNVFYRAAFQGNNLVYVVVPQP